jgi:hypothetical protein
MAAELGEVIAATGGVVVVLMFIAWLMSLQRR